MTVQLIDKNFRQPTFDSVYKKSEQKQIEKTIFNKAMEYKRAYMHNEDAQFFSRQLAFWYPRYLMKIYPDLQYRMYTSSVPVAPYTKNMVFEQYNPTGNPKTKSRRAGDIGIVGSTVIEQTEKVLSITGGIQFDWVELEAIKNAPTYNGQQSGQAYRTRMQALTRFFEQKKNEWILYGEPDYGIFGFLSDPTIPSGNVGTSWTTATLAQKLEDLVDGYTQVIVNSKKKITPDTLFMDLSSYVTIFAKPTTPYVGYTPISWVTEKLPGIQRIIADPYLDNKGLNDGGVAFFTQRNSDNHNYGVGLEMMPMPPVFEGTLYTLNFLARMTGLNVIRSMSTYKLNLNP